MLAYLFRFLWSLSHRLSRIKYKHEPEYYQENAQMGDEIHSSATVPEEADELANLERL